MSNSRSTCLLWTVLCAALLTTAAQAAEPPVGQEVKLQPGRKWIIYLLPHSHVDIGYTHVQTDVEKLQMKHIDVSLEQVRRTADFPAGARFKWNSEVLWAVESYLKQSPPEKQQAFIEAVKNGSIGLDGMYGNELTALCRPEELLRLFDYARRLRKQHNLPLDSAMISDVPGYTWGITTAMAQSGVKYFSVGMNRGDRIGYALSTWADKPFYWLSPSGGEKVLCWVHGEGYSWFHGGRISDANRLFEYLGRLERANYPFDIVVLRYNIGGDNGPPDPKLPDFVKEWNSQREYPKLIIATTGEAFREFERRYGDKLREVRGDFTPYWEDGAASSARETATNRGAAENLTQAETLWAMLDPKRYPAEDFYAAWRNVILYDEHTWGAHNSISQPDSPFVQAQWKIKSNFALDAAAQAGVLTGILLERHEQSSDKPAAFLVLNTCSWPRTGLIVLPAEEKPAGDVVRDGAGKPLPSQRLSEGGLAVLMRDVPPLAAVRITMHEGKAKPEGKAKAQGNRLTNGILSLVVDEKTGAIASLKAAGIAEELVDGRAALGLNDYFYVPGKNPAEAKRCGPVKVTVVDSGPLAASLKVESDAPGCRKLIRCVCLVDGSDAVSIHNLVDKEKVRTKEGVHFAFPFNVPDGVMRMDLPWAVARPEQDQLPGSCKNWFTVQRWVDVSNDKYGVTWATVDAPLLEVGSITAEMPWIKTLKPSQTLYSYVMNNYWHTNYRADQEGVHSFCYALRPHAGAYKAIEAIRVGIRASQPLLIVPSKADAPAVIPSRLRVEPDEVLATLKPSDDRKALIVRLFNPGEKTCQARLTWGEPLPTKVSLSNLSEEPLQAVTGPIEVPALGLVTVRAELPE